MHIKTEAMGPGAPQLSLLPNGGRAPYLAVPGLPVLPIEVGAVTVLIPPGSLV